MSRRACWPTIAPPSHIAAILPFVRSPLTPTPLVVGCMVPDLPYFLLPGIARELTHSIAGGLSPAFWQ